MGLESSRGLWSFPKRETKLWSSASREEDISSVLCNFTPFDRHPLSETHSLSYESHVSLWRLKIYLQAEPMGQSSCGPDLLQTSTCQSQHYPKRLSRGEIKPKKKVRMFTLNHFLIWAQSPSTRGFTISKITETAKKHIDNFHMLDAEEFTRLRTPDYGYAIAPSHRIFWH